MPPNDHLMSLSAEMIPDKTYYESAEILVQDLPDVLFAQ